MPGIVVFRRRWMVASDDFVIPFGIAFALRGIWMAILCVTITIFHGFMHSHMAHKEDLHRCEQTMDYFIGGYLALLFATNIMEFSIAWMSGKGSIMDTEPRALIPYLLYIRLVLSFIEVVWLSLGIKWIFIETSCQLTPETYVSRAIIVFNWGFLFVVTVIIFCVFDSAGRTWFNMQRAHYNVDMTDSCHSYSANIAERYEQRWKSCFRICCCRVGERQGDENVYTFIGRTLSEYFQDLDVVPSDFAAGLVLLRRHQKLQEQRELQRAIDEERINKHGVKKTSLRYQRTNTARSLRLEEKLERDLFKEVVYYMNYALAAYGWPVYMKSNVICGCCSLSRSFRCCYCCRKPDRRPHKTVDVEGDNCCRCHFSALKVTSGLKNTDIVYVSYHNELYCPPFYVALDHDRKSVVITIRGTLSIQDILTDFIVEPERIPVEGGSPLWFGHKGMVHAAVYVKKKLIDGGILSRAFNSAPERGSKLYSLKLVGHSLGAGTASILAFMLRPMFKDLFCYAYSPPGANMSLSAARFAKEFTISVIIGKDMIPRLSLYTLEDLRNKIMAIISHCREPKWKILRGCACRCVFCCGLCGGGGGAVDQRSDLERLAPLPDNKKSKAPRFYPPGKIIHVVKTVSVSRRFGKKLNEYEPVWAEAEDFQSILISSLMWADHMPDFVLEALNKCLPHREQEIEWVRRERERTPYLQVPGQRSSRTSNGYDDSGAVDNGPEGGASKEMSFKESFALAVDNGPEVGVAKEMSSKESFALVVKTLHRPSSLCSIESVRAPIARPESGIDDSDVEEKPQDQRISRHWENFTLSIVEQSSDSLDVTPRQRSSTDEQLIEKCQTLPYNFPKPSTSRSLPGSLNTSRTLSFHSPRGRPPKKPPRTFATELAEGLPSFTCKPPPKPPRTFEHCSEQDINSKAFSSLDWDFPYSRTTDLNSPHSQPSLSETQDKNDGEILPPYSPHRKRKLFDNSYHYSSADQLKGSVFLNSVRGENERNSSVLKSNSTPYSSHCHCLDGQISPENSKRNPVLTGITPNTHVKTSITDSGMTCPEEDRTSSDSVTSEGHDFDTLCWSCGETAGIALVTAGSRNTHKQKTAFLETIL